MAAYGPFLVLGRRAGYVRSTTKNSVSVVSVSFSVIFSVFFRKALVKQ